MKNFSVKAFLSKLLIFVICLFSFGITIFNPISIKNSPSVSCSYTAAAFPSFTEIIKGLFKKDTPAVDDNKERVSVYLGGFPLGFTISCSGVVVVAISNTSATGVKEGDILTHIEDVSVNSAENILSVINSENFVGKKLNITYIHDGTECKGSITPIYDDALQIYKLGLWVRDNAAGVGTLTYIRKDNYRFGALGHPVCDIDTGATMPVLDGNLFKCNIVGYKRGAKGAPGELKGLFLRNGSELGSLDKNIKFGVYGTFDKNFISSYDTELVEVARSNEVRSGKAKIRCTIDGTVPKDYDIEIVKTYFNGAKDNKSMFIRVTDKELISKTGGIVQGMSGSPIIQNGRLVGAVTHVFVSDSTKGYGVFAEYMIDN